MNVVLGWVLGVRIPIPYGSMLSLNTRAVLVMLSIYQILDFVHISKMDTFKVKSHTCLYKQTMGVKCLSTCMATGFFCLGCYFFFVRIPLRNLRMTNFESGFTSLFGIFLSYNTPCTVIVLSPNQTLPCSS